MKKVFYIFLSRPITSAMLFLCVTILGIVSFFNIPIELSPNVDYPKLSVSITWGSVSPEAVEANVTSILEAELAGIKQLKKIQSSSSEGKCTINLEFHPGTDMDFTRIEINERLSAIRKELPYGVGIPNVSRYVPSDLQELQGFLVYTVSGNESANAIRKFVKDNLIYPLKSIDGVSDVSVYGGSEREIRIIIDYEKVKALGIRNDEISTAVSDAHIIEHAGRIDNGSSQEYVKIVNYVNSIEDIKNQVVKKRPDGSIVRIRDIGDVIDDYADRTNYYRINGKETVTITISKEQGTNTIAVAEIVKNKLAGLSETFPPGYVEQKEIDKSISMKHQLDELSTSAVWSLAVIIIVLLIIFRNIKYALVITTSIIFSLFLSLLLFYLFKLPLNVLTIASFIIGFGFMVDNSIVVIDFISKHYNGQGIKHLAVIIKDIFFPVFASTFTTIAVFIPLIFLTGELRLYFEQFALGITFTLFSSLIVSFTIIPSIYIRVIKLHYRIITDNIGVTSRVYSFLIHLISKWKKLAVTFLILIIGLPVWLLPSRIETPVLAPVYNAVFDTDYYSDARPYVNYILGGSLNLFFNHISRGQLWSWGESTYLSVRLELPNGNRIERINELTKAFESEVLQYKDRIKHIIARVYSDELAYIGIEFTDKQAGTAFPYMLKNYLTAYAARLGGLAVGVSGFGPGFYNGMGGSTSSMSVKIKGFNFNRVKEIAEEYRDIIEKNPRIDNIDINKTYRWGAKDTYEISANVNRNNLAGKNMMVENLFRSIANSTEGNLGGQFFMIKNEEVPYRIKFSNYRNLQLDKLENMIVINADSGQTKVKDIVEFERKKVLANIIREDQQYMRNVTFDYKGPYKYGNKFVESSISKMTVPEGYSIEKENYMIRFGDEEETEIWNILAISVLLIFMITASLFESLKKPAIVIIAIPFAIIGTIILYYFGEYSLDRGAYAGILLLIGLSVNNSIILVDYLSKNLSGIEIDKIVKLSYQRLRPIFTTSITTIGALIPLLLSAESTFWKSLSLSIIGGIILSSLIVILYVPIIYHYLCRYIPDKVR